MISKWEFNRELKEIIEYFGKLGERRYTNKFIDKVYEEIKDLELENLRAMHDKYMMEMTYPPMGKHYREEGLKYRREIWKRKAEERAEQEETKHVDCRLCHGTTVLFVAHFKDKEEVLVACSECEKGRVNFWELPFYDDIENEFELIGAKLETWKRSESLSPLDGKILVKDKVEESKHYFSEVYNVTLGKDSRSPEDSK